MSSKTVAFVVTGELERKALPPALERLFRSADTTFLDPIRVDGITHSCLRSASSQIPAGVRRNLDKFVEQMIIWTLYGVRKHEPRPDIVIGLDDLEVDNCDSPAEVIACLREGVRDFCRELSIAQVERVRDRCSFHLLAPMAEAYFFADPAALALATAGGLTRPSRFDAEGRDVEEFLVDSRDDPEYHSPANVTGKNDWRKANRTRHPKHYVQYLCDPELDGNTRYREGRSGASAFAALEWSRVLKHDQRASFMRSLVADLADGLDVTDQELSVPLRGRTHTLTWPPPQKRVLRNL